MWLATKNVGFPLIDTFRGGQRFSGAGRLGGERLSADYGQVILVFAVHGRAWHMYPDSQSQHFRRLLEAQGSAIRDIDINLTR